MYTIISFSSIALDFDPDILIFPKIWISYALKTFLRVLLVEISEHFLRTLQEGLDLLYSTSPILHCTIDICGHILSLLLGCKILQGRIHESRQKLTFSTWALTIWLKQLDKHTNDGFGGSSFHPASIHSYAVSRHSVSALCALCGTWSWILGEGVR